MGESAFGLIRTWQRVGVSANCLENKGYNADEEDEEEEGCEEGHIQEPLEEAAVARVAAGNAKDNPKNAHVKGGDTFGLSTEKSALLEMEFDAGCERPNKKQIKSISLKIGVTSSQCKHWFKKRRAYKHLLANREKARGDDGGQDAAARGQGDATSKGTKDKSDDVVRIRDIIERVSSPSQFALDIAAASALLSSAVGIESEPGSCSRKSVTNMPIWAIPGVAKQMWI